MNDVVIHVENLGKRYRVGQLEPYKTLRDTLVNAVSVPIHAVTSAFHRRHSTVGGSPSDNTIWSLKGISFEVKQGEVIGIIGSNGSGKTTLLRILSRITDPTEGYAEIHGRVGSLLEVGTGFHTELTGRENIYLNGAILGMKRAEVKRKFDEIVDFSGVEEFIDTPVKRYSSGMKARLAFAVAAHLESEILLVDEVLAVGDAAFQKKSLGKMSDVARGGRTVLFVSHNMAAVVNLCGRVILLDSGRITQTGPVSEVVQSYLAGVDEGESSIALEDRQDHQGDGRLRVTRVSLADGEGHPVNCLQSGEDAQIILNYQVPSGQELRNTSVSLAIDSVWGQRLCVLQTDYVGGNLAEIGPEGRFRCSIPQLPLAAGLYLCTIFITVNGVIVDWVINAGRIRVEGGDFYGYGKYPDPQDGLMLIRHTWTHSDNK